MHTEERIRINHEPISQDLFAKYYFEVEEMLRPRSDNNQFDRRPQYLQTLSLLAFHTFIREGVDTAIFETHHGGEFDATNVIQMPVVTAMVQIGIDHTKQLGTTYESIAWTKAGMFKRGTPAVTLSSQEPEAAHSLRRRAAEIGADLIVVNRDPCLPTDLPQLKPDVQRTNCSLAIAIVRIFLERVADKTNADLTTSDIRDGISNFSWPGRYQLVTQGKTQWYLDGAHNEMSVTIAAEWFMEAAEMQRYGVLSSYEEFINISRLTSDISRTLIFSLITDQRDATAVFQRLVTALKNSRIDSVVFTTYETDVCAENGNDFDCILYLLLLTVSTEQSTVKSLHQMAQLYLEIWKQAFPHTDVFLEPSIRGALKRGTNISEKHSSSQILITGSQHLVGGALSILNRS